MQVGKSLAWLVLAVLIAGTVSAPAQATDNTGQKYWQTGFVWYKLVPSSFPSADRTVFVNAAVSAAGKWDSGTDIAIFQGVDSTSTDWTDTYSHIVFYGTYPSSWNCSSTYIACTGTLGSGSYLTDVDTVYHSSASYTNTCDWWPGADYDIETVFLHEFGHWGTLDESSDTGAVMRGSYWNCLQNLTQHDINSMNSVY